MHPRLDRRLKPKKYPQYICLTRPTSQQNQWTIQCGAENLMGVPSLEEELCYRQIMDAEGGTIQFLKELVL